MDDDVKEFLDQASKLTEAIGRKIRSPKNGLKDLDDLADALHTVSDTVRALRRTQNMRNQIAKIKDQGK